MSHYLSNVVTLKLDRERCNGCGACLDVCPHAVLAAGVDARAVRVRDRDACMECGACARNCPLKAIEVRAGVGCATALINAKLSGGAPTCGCDGDSAANCC